MSQGLCLLDEALDLARQEMLALEDGAYDRAVELAERRNEVTSMAWHVLESGSTDQYRNRLIELTRLQEHLADLAAKAQEVIRASLQRSRRENSACGATTRRWARPCNKSAPCNGNDDAPASRRKPGLFASPLTDGFRVKTPSTVEN